MARTKKAVKDSTAKQTNTAKQNSDSINVSPSNKDSLKSHSVTSQEQTNGVESNNKIVKYEPTGRPPVIIDYDKLTEFASQPISNKDIAIALDMSVSTFYKYMREDPEFKSAYERGMDNRKYELEKALYKRATGFEAQEVVTEKDNEGNVTKTKITDKSYVPDTTAAIFALKNVYPDKYKDRIETVTDINVNINQMQQLSNEELSKLVSTNIVEADYSIE